MAANYKSFQESSESVRIEVEGSGGGSSPYSGPFLSTLRDLAVAIASQFSQLSDDQRPAELEVKFGLRGMASGGFAICIDRAQANFLVSLKWGDQGGGGGGGLLGGLGIPPIPGA